MPVDENRLELLLLGRPIIRVGGQELAEGPPLKSQALLYYLAVTGRPCSRDLLATLFWGEMADATARTNLRLALSRLRGAIGDWLLVDRHTVALDPTRAPWVDAVIFAEAMRSQAAQSADALRAAANLYRGALLDDFLVPDAPDFTTWVATERERYAQLLLSGLKTLADGERATGRHREAIPIVRRMLEVAPWNEEAHCDLMWLLAVTGQRSAALAQYETCRRILDEELSVPPSAATETLRTRIAADDVPLAGVILGDLDGGAAALPANVEGVLQPLPARVRNAPDYPDDLLGRDAAIAELRTLLTDPTCRLLTLTGAGGVGKTRLALAASAAMAGCYPDGAYFVNLAGLTPARPESSTDLVLNSIANALGYTFDAQQEPQTILLNHLRGKQLLLICDNFEQLQPAAALLEAIILAAPGVQLLVTSRKRLGAAHEWIYEVEGLAYAHTDQRDQPLSAYPSTALFVRRARQVKAGFDPTTETVETDAIHHICQVLEGWPLSIELAANWLRLLPCPAIAERLQSDVAMLDAATTAPGDRHRSMRAVLDASWELLTDAEQQACCGAACFRGGFELAAAEAVVGTDLVQLASLVDKSFLSRDANGRYHMHEQVRQYAAARLGEDAQRERDVRRRHSAYFLTVAATHPTPPGGVPDAATLVIFDRELENLRLALAHALGDEDVPTVAALLENSLPYYRFKGWNSEISDLLAQACELYGTPLATRARWQRWWAESLYQVGDLPACIRRVEVLMRMAGKPLPTTRTERFWFAFREFGRQVLHRMHVYLGARRDAERYAILVETARALERYGQAGYFLDKQIEFLIGIAGINDAESADAQEFRAAGYATVTLLLANLALHRLAAYYHRLSLQYIDYDVNLAHRAYTLEIIGLNYFVSGDWVAARRVMAEGVGMADQSARRRFSLEIQMVMAISCGIPGDYVEALRRAALVLPRAQELGDAVVQAWSLLAQAEFCLHADENATVRALPLLEQAQALPHDEINKCEHFRIHGNLAAVALRSGDTAAAVQQLDQALAILDGMVLPANWAFEGYANVPEVALALAALPDLAPAAQRAATARAGHACTILRKFARAHRFARPRALIFDGIALWQQGKRGKAFKAWQKAVAVAANYAMRYDIARTHFEIGRHLAAGETWDGYDTIYYLEQARAEFAEIGAGYMLARVERLCSIDEDATQPG